MTMKFLIKRARRRKAPGGFSMVEVLVSVTLVVLILAIAAAFYINAKKFSKSQTAGLNMQQAARVAVDEIARTLQQAGYGIDRSDPYNSSTWQDSLMYAGAHAVALNVDIDASLGATGQTLNFPTGESYVGTGSGSSVGAESYVYTLDANNDGSLTLVDREAAETGSTNPASRTENPLDFSLYRRVYGHDGSSEITQVAPIVPYLFTNAVATVKYADLTIPEPLFTYVLTEDLDGDNILSAGECVNDTIDSCDPNSARPPDLYIWGDSNFDGVLSDAEKDLLRQAPVGSVSWTKNPLVESGAYKQTSLSLDADPDDYQLRVVDGTKIAPGAHIQVGTETFEVLNVSTTSAPHSVLLTSNVQITHFAGATVQVLPRTLRQAIRAIQINFTAISPRKDLVAGVGPAGQAGRATEHGMEYRTMILRKMVELVNHQTTALISSGVSPPTPTLPDCPLSIISDCSGSPMPAVAGVAPTTIPLGFMVTDVSSAPVAGATVSFSQTNTSAGSLSSSTAPTAGSGLVTVAYIPAAPGTSTVDATVACVDPNGVTVQTTDSVVVTTARLDITPAQNCLSTVSTRVPEPQTGYTITVTDPNGLIPYHPVDVSLQVDGNYLSPPGFTQVRADLEEGVSYVGSTDTAGYFGYLTDTGSSGVLTGAVKLVQDTSVGGTRVNFSASTATAACSIYGATATAPLTFYKLAFDSLDPSPGCYQGAPCVIPAGDNAPRAFGTLSIAGQMVPNATLTFSTVDTHGPPDTPPAASSLNPGATIPTDTSGQGIVKVTNNGSSSITSSNPLDTLVDVTSSGESGICIGGTIVASDPQVAFQFEGDTAVATCNIDMQQSWVFPDGPRTCFHAFNDDNFGDCPKHLIGLKIQIYQADDVTSDPTITLKKIKGGTIDNTASCSKDLAVTLFDWKCNSDTYLPNGTRWDFIDGFGCSTSPNEVPPQLFYVFNRVEFGTPTPSNRRMVVTLYYDCTGSCSGNSGLSRTFELRTPY